MSESEAADNGGGEEDCPLCLKPLPPFWDQKRRTIQLCCSQFICADCWGKRSEFLERAANSGAFGREEEQLARSCPLCRARMPQYDSHAKILEQKFEEGHLPLDLHLMLVYHYLHGRNGVAKNVERGNEILSLGAKKGDPECQYHLGSWYVDGRNGLFKSTPEAKRWFLAAAEQGHAPAEYELARIAMRGGNDAEFLRYLRRSASKGYDDACGSLGLVHAKGANGLEKSRSEAIRVLTPAAERGHVVSMSVLGGILCDGENALTPWDNPNYTRGVHLIRRAAEKGNQGAILVLEHIEKKGCSKRCFRCNQKALPDKAFLRCSRCRAAWYCSKECQVRHWKAEEGGHKQCCIKWVDESE